jgi:hypothetical protein
MPRLHLYGRTGWPLCAEMKDALAVRAERFDLVEFDVDSDEALARRYGARVPVLTGPDGTEICHYFLDERALREYLDAA